MSRRAGQAVATGRSWGARVAIGAGMARKATSASHTWFTGKAAATFGTREASGAYRAALARTTNGADGSHFAW